MRAIPAAGVWLWTDRRAHVEHQCPDPSSSYARTLALQGRAQHARSREGKVRMQCVDALHEMQDVRGQCAGHVAHSSD
jgi:hypothetical protein